MNGWMLRGKPIRDVARVSKMSHQDITQHEHESVEPLRDSSRRRDGAPCEFPMTNCRSAQHGAGAKSEKGSLNERDPNVAERRQRTASRHCPQIARGSFLKSCCAHCCDGYPKSLLTPRSLVVPLVPLVPLVVPLVPLVPLVPPRLPGRMRFCLKHWIMVLL